jgi:glycosyltransferase involved in cell wall biosynthesis
MDISVVVPCFNEEENIGLLHIGLKNTMDNLGSDYEIIFVDDGSNDKTAYFIKEISFQATNRSLIMLNKNYGKDYALNAGFKKAKGAIIVTIDSDLQNSPEDIPLLLDKLRECDAVIGWRKSRNTNFSKIISSQIANFLRRKILNEDWHDAGCGLRAFKKECLRELGTFNLFDLFLMSMLKIKDYKVSEVVIRDAPRKFGKSNFNIHNRLFTNGKKLFVIWRLKRKLLQKFPG